MATPPPAPRGWRIYYQLAFGLLLGLALLKFGNPVVLDHKVAPPASLEEAIAFSWPASWANWIFGLLGLGGLLAVKPSAALARSRTPAWLLIAPLVWLAWQIVAGTRSVDSQLSHLTLVHFCVCALCYLAGVLVLAHDGWPRLLLPGLLAAFAFCLVKGANQHHFEFRRDYEVLSEGQRTGWTNFAPEVLASLKQNQLVIVTNGVDVANPAILDKLRRGRIHGTLVYPNAFAGAILLLLPACLAGVFTGTGGLRPWLRWVVIGLTVGLGLGCLYWTGSKSGWLIALGMAGLGLMLRSPLPGRMKFGITLAILVVGLGLFGIRFRQYFAAGATSVSARVDYWRAAVQVVREQPLFGSGPGTFQRPYARLKAPESEMARLTHNDYLEQASDSGLPGFIAYLAWIAGALWAAGRRALSPVGFGVFLGLAGWFAQGVSEFSLYIPALAWTAFTLLGVLVGLPPGQNGSTPPANES